MMEAVAIVCVLAGIAVGRLPRVGAMMVASGAVTAAATAAWLADPHACGLLAVPLDLAAFQAGYLIAIALAGGRDEGGLLGHGPLRLRRHQVTGALDGRARTWDRGAMFTTSSQSRSQQRPRAHGGTVIG